MEGTLIITRPYRDDAGVLCRVTRETPQRYYVDIVGEPTTRFYMSVVQGAHRRGSSGYVDKGDVLAFGATPEQYEEYKARWEAHRERLLAEEQAHRAERDALIADRDADIRALLGAGGA